MKTMQALTVLSIDQLTMINGGGDGPSTKTSFLHDVAYAIGVTAKSFWHFCKTASEFQASLPPSLKK